jgi:hypothetical protein
LQFEFVVKTVRRRRSSTPIYLLRDAQSTKFVGVILVIQFKFAAVIYDIPVIIVFMTLLPFAGAVREHQVNVIERTVF